MNKIFRLEISAARTIFSKLRFYTHSSLRGHESIQDLGYFVRAFLDPLILYIHDIRLYCSNFNQVPDAHSSSLSNLCGYSHELANSPRLVLYYVGKKIDVYQSKLLHYTDKKKHIFTPNLLYSQVILTVHRSSFDSSWTIFCKNELLFQISF